MKVSISKTLTMYWRQILFVVLVLNIAIAMALYKVSIIPDSSAEYIYLMIVLEFALAVTLFSQALLRDFDEFAADTAFQYSIYLRLGVGVVGCILFAELADWNHDSSKMMSYSITASSAFKWSHLFSYQLCNLIALLVEWMFSRLLQYKAHDFKADAERLAAELLVLQQTDEKNKQLEDGFAFIKEMIETKTQPSVDVIPVILNGEVKQLSETLILSKIGQRLAHVAIRVSASTRILFCGACGHVNQIGQKVKEDELVVCKQCSNEMSFVDAKSMSHE